MVEWKEKQMYPWVNGIEFLNSLNSNVITEAADRRSMLGFFIFFGWIVTFGFLSMFTIAILALLQTIEWLMATFFMSVDNGIQNSKDNSFKELFLCIMGIVLTSPIMFTYGLPRLIWDTFNKMKEVPPEPVMTFDEIVEVLGREERKQGDFKPKRVLAKHRIRIEPKIRPQPVKIERTYNQKMIRDIRTTDSGTHRVSPRMKRRV